MKLARLRTPMACLFLLAAVLSGDAPSGRTDPQKVASVSVQGNNNISSEIILSVVKTKAGTDLSEAQLALDERAIQRLGFFHEVHARQEPDPAGAGVRVIFTVIEHPKVTSIEITGNTKIKTQKLLDQMLTRPGMVFNEDAFRKDIDKIEKLYRDQGYGMARVTEEASPTPEGVLKIPIDEGHIEKIEVLGLKKTKKYVVLREMDTKEGDVFSATVLQQDMLRLRNLDFFESLNFEPTPTEPGKAVLVVNCKEKKTGTVSIGLGYSSRERLVGFAEIAEHNFRGVGQEIGVRWDAGQFTNRTGYELTFNDPWMLGKRTSFGVQLYDRTTNRPLVLGGTTPDTWIYEKRKGIGFSVGKPVGQYDRLLFDLRSDDVGYSAVDGYPVPPAEYLTSEGRVNSLTVRAIRNTRDLDINPHRGALYSFSSEMAGGPLGGRWSYTKLGMDLRRYFPVGGAKPDGSNQKVLAMRLMGGLSIGNIPLSENYWIGGAESLRGYREDQFHGTRTLLYSTEFRVPFGPSLQGVTFFDYGYAWPKGQSFRLADMEPAIGVGIRVVTPLGPLRLDYGFGKEGGRTHFSIGHVF